MHVRDDFQVQLIEWPTGRNLSLDKPRFLLHVLNEAAPDAGGAVFFDADITVHGSWNFFERWFKEGLALCLDACYPLVPSGHPWRAGWRRLANEAGYDPIRSSEYYVNSGFVGVPRSLQGTIEVWAALINHFVQTRSMMVDAVKFAAREDAFVGDQDMLNAALMTTDDPLSILGLEGMDFAAAGYTMSHAVEGNKPWKKRFVRDALSGRPPSTADKHFWNYADHPLRLFGPAQVRLQRSSLKLASAVGRFYRTSS
ncbi:hypothetical protein DYQ86_05475 [Acidobacteria bacterium AB60]|nr:hypothetical protein DYQ86_05475 [Acidobacteria bacterium AB60]